MYLQEGKHYSVGPVLFQEGRWYRSLEDGVFEIVPAFLHEGWCCRRASVPQEGRCDYSRAALQIVRGPILL